VNCWTESFHTPDVLIDYVTYFCQRFCVIRMLTNTLRYIVSFQLNSTDMGHCVMKTPHLVTSSVVLLVSSVCTYSE